MDEVQYYDGELKTQHPVTIIGCNPKQISDYSAPSSVSANLLKDVKVACDNDKNFPRYNCLNAGETLQDEKETKECVFKNYNKTGDPVTAVEQDCGDWRAWESETGDATAGWGRRCVRSCGNCADPMFNIELCKDVIDAKECENVRKTGSCDPRGADSKYESWWAKCPRTCAQATEKIARQEGTENEHGKQNSGCEGGCGNPVSTVNVGGKHIKVGWHGICRNSKYNKNWVWKTGGAVGKDQPSGECVETPGRRQMLSLTPEMRAGTNIANKSDNPKLKTKCIYSIDRWRDRTVAKGDIKQEGGNTERGARWTYGADRGFSGNYRYNSAVRVKNGALRKLS